MSLRGEEQKLCCEVMAASLDSLPELRASETWRSSLILYEPVVNEYGLPIRLADELAYEQINFCPWCGTSLESARSQST
jgi:hypothetical protein